MKRKKPQTGTNANTPAAIICPKSTENFETNAKRPTGKVLTSADELSIKAKSNSLQAAVNTNPTVAARPGKVSGRMIVQSAVKRLAPSIIADSSSSLGMASKNDC